MDTEIMVSIVCLTYNQVNYIEDALKSFVSQKTDFSYEIIVHDDASTDGTLEVIKKYASEYPKLIFPLYEEKNQYSQGKNIYLECVRKYCRGKYIAWCEGDDFWIDPLKLEKQINFLEDNDDYCACVHETYLLNCLTGEKMRINGNTESYDLSIKEIINRNELTFQLSSLVYRKNEDDRLLELKPEFFFVAEGYFDLVLGLFLLTEGKVRFINETMSCYRRFAVNSWTVSHTDAKRKAEHLNNVCSVFSRFDEYTKREHHYEISQLVIQKKKEIETLDSDRLTGLKIKLKMGFPYLYKLYYRIKKSFRYSD